MATRWKLKEFLESEGVTPYALAQKASGRVSQKSVYRLTQGDLEGIRFNTLDTIIPALRELTGKPVQITDLLDFED